LDRQVQAGKIRDLYNSINNSLDASEFGSYATFLNYGFIDDKNISYKASKGRKLQANCVALIHEIIGDTDLSSSFVVDIGCGRGGTVSVIHDMFPDSRILGVDICSLAISFCNSQNALPGVSFEIGDAQALNLQDASVDVIVNVESAHSYPNPHAFFLEAGRAIKHGGYFLYADILPCETIEIVDRTMSSIGFDIIYKRNITKNVLASLDASNTAILKWPGVDSDVIRDFLASPGSRVYQEMLDGRMDYIVRRFRKTGKLSPSTPDMFPKNHFLHELLGS